ncbi:hypothetical protein D1007_12110 [Hordeum vulgare]|nr:hypothetical protein D1007_12110 [Hordeum vulgare]
MGAGNNNITKLLESLITKVDEQKLFHNKQIEIQAAFNNQFFEELHGLAKQIDLTQANIALTRKMVERSSSTPDRSPPWSTKPRSHNHHHHPRLCTTLRIWLVRQDRRFVWGTTVRP